MSVKLGITRASCSFADRTVREKPGFKYLLHGSQNRRCSQTRKTLSLTTTHDSPNRCPERWSIDLTMEESQARR